jgi:putative glutamine amidotransferase
LPTSLLHRVFGETVANVNSHHHQALDPYQLSPELQVIAIAKDGVVEAVQCSDNYPLLAVQFHPERPSYNPRFKEIFRWVVQAAGG